uniref:hypothetical protein n=1 Tax=Methylobacterium sp. B34 TaxID=95563 RepID=UPI0019552DD9
IMHCCYFQKESYCDLHRISKQFSPYKMIACPAFNVLKSLETLGIVEKTPCRFKEVFKNPPPRPPPRT